MGLGWYQRESLEDDRLNVTIQKESKRKVYHQTLRKFDQNASRKQGLAVKGSEKGKKENKKDLLYSELYVKNKGWKKRWQE
jgi:hypothetical protein